MKQDFVIARGVAPWQSSRPCGLLWRPGIDTLLEVKDFFWMSGAKKEIGVTNLSESKVIL